MNSLYDSATGEEFRLGPDGRYYHAGAGYEVMEGDKSPLGSGGTLVSAPPNTGTLPKQGTSAISTTMGQSGNEHRMLAGRMIQEVAGGKNAQRIVDNLIKVTSPLQVVQQGVMDAFMDYYAQLEGAQQSEIDTYLEKFEADPLYTVDVMMGDLTRNDKIDEVVRQEVYNIVARYNLTIP